MRPPRCCMKENLLIRFLQIDAELVGRSNGGIFTSSMNKGKGDAAFFDRGARGQ